MAQLLRDAFPSALAGDVDAVIPKLPRRDWGREDFHLADYPGTRILRFLESLPAKE